MINRQETKKLFGYFPEDLAENSNKKIAVDCQYCGNICIKTKYNWKVESKKKNPKAACESCRKIKQQEYYELFPELKVQISKTLKKSCLEKYGVENYTQTDEYKIKAKESYHNLSEEEKQNRKDKAEKTNLERYGVKAPSMLQEIKDKSVQTKLEKYGVENNSQLPNWKETLRESALEQHGVESFAQLDSVRDKTKATNLERYGVESVLSHPDIRAKAKQTCVDRYGVENPQQCPEIKKKTEETCLEKYGTTNPFGNYQIQKKIAATKFKDGKTATSQQQIYINQVYGGLLNYNVEYFHADIYLPNDKIACEYDGGGHNLSVKLGYITESEFKRCEIKRWYIFKSNGIKIMKIISLKDLIPQSDILIEMLNFAKNILDSGRSWINFDIDNGTVKWRDNEQTYDFGPLQKITKTTPLENNLEIPTQNTYNQVGS